MEQDQDQTWGQWKNLKKWQGKNVTHESEMKPYPEKSQSVERFLKMTARQKDDFRKSEEWPIVAKYFDDIQEIRHHNSSVMNYKIKMGQKPWGLVDYGDGTLLATVSSPNGAPLWPECDFYREGRKTKKLAPLKEPTQEEMERVAKRKAELKAQIEEDEVPF